MNILSGEVFASCSDDRTIRVYDPLKEGFPLVCTLDTYFIEEWHTLTYMALEENGSRLAAVSENGYLFVWELKGEKPEVIYARKIH